MKIKSLIFSLILTTFCMCGLFNSTTIEQKLDIDLKEQSIHSKSFKNDILHDPSFFDEQVSCIESEKTISGVTETFKFISTT